MEVMPLRRGNSMSRYTRGISINLATNFSDRLFPRPQAAAYTHNTILSDFEATGIWHLTAQKVFQCKSRPCTSRDAPHRFPICCSNKNSPKAQTCYPTRAHCNTAIALSNTLFSEAHVSQRSASTIRPGGSCRHRIVGGNGEISSFWGQGYH